MCQQDSETNSNPACRGVREAPLGSAVALPLPGNLSDMPPPPPRAPLHGSLLKEGTPELSRAMNTITLAGCLCMVYLEFTGASPQVEFARKLGAEDFHFGVIGAIPPLMLFLQFGSALLAQRLRRRKRLWMTLLISQRSLMVPIALLPWVCPSAGSTVWVWSMIGILALGEGLGNLGTPLWFSWMGDLLPHRSLTEFWAGRRRWLAIASTASLMLAAGFFALVSQMDIRITYLIVATLGAAAGISDILLFTRVPEPVKTHLTALNWKSLGEPFRDDSFRRFIFFWAFWSFAATFSFPFFRVYFLKVLGMPLSEVILLYCCNALGGTILAQKIGRLSDRWGQRPMIILSTALKSFVVLGVFFARPGLLILPLIPCFMVDNMVNTGLICSQNAFMLKQSPSQNRTSYVAAVLATSGLAGGAASLLGGVVLKTYPDFHLHALGLEWTNYHLVFAISIVLRWASLVPAIRIREPGSTRTREALLEVLGPDLYRVVSLPLAWFDREEEDEEG